jgi:vancomycin resistance protein YoaR
MPVPYVPYGQDATVLYGVLDFKFKNDTSFPILIWAESIGNNLFIAFYGSELPPRVEWRHQVLQIIKADKDYKHNPDFEFGEERLLLEGMDGAVVKSQVTVYYKDGSVTTKEMGYSYYDPLPFLYEKKLY